MAHKLKVGQKVEFQPTHQKGLKLVGTITKISADHDVVTVKAIPDGKVIEVAREFEAHAPEVTVLAEAGPDDAEEKTA